MIYKITYKTCFLSADGTFGPVDLENQIMFTHLPIEEIPVALAEICKKESEVAEIQKIEIINARILS